MMNKNTVNTQINVIKISSEEIFKKSFIDLIVSFFSVEPGLDMIEKKGASIPIPNTSVKEDVANKRKSIGSFFLEFPRINQIFLKSLFCIIMNRLRLF
jgi:hypothetical protein